MIRVNPLFRSLVSIRQFPFFSTQKTPADDQPKKRTENVPIKKSKKEMKQDALAAAMIIRLFKSQPLLYKDEDKEKSKPGLCYSLGELALKELREKGKDVGIGESAIKTFEQMFDPRRGVVLPPHLTAQRRILQATNEIEQKFSFFPNRLVTIEVFQTIFKLRCETLMYGPPGISKTSSIVLYSYLCYLINQYEFQFDEVVASDIPRLFYFSYENIEKKSPNVLTLNQLKSKLESYIKSLLILHFPSRFASNLESKTTLNKAIQEVKIQFNKKNIKKKVAVDQFNSLIAQFRKFNIFLKDGKIDKSQILQRKQRMNLHQSFWVDMTEDLSRILGPGPILYNSSRNIEDYLLGQSTGDQVTINLNYHQNVRKVDIDFFPLLNNVAGKRQIVRTLFFELKRLCEKQELFEKITTVQERYLANPDSEVENLPTLDLTHYQIRKYMTSSTIDDDPNGKASNLGKDQLIRELLTITEQSPPKKVNEFVRTAIKKMTGYFLGSIKQKLEKFCDQGTTEDKLSRLSFLLEIRRMLADQVQKNPQLQNNIPNYTRKSWLQANNKTSLLSKNINKQLFNYSKTQNPDQQKSIVYLEGRMSLKDILYVTSFAQQKMLQLKSNQFIKIMESFNISRSVLGQRCQKCILDLLYQFPNQKLIVGQFNALLVPTNKSTFLHFNAQESMPLSQRIQKLIKLNQKCVLGFPIQKEKVQRRQSDSLRQRETNYSRTSRSIDLIILHRTQHKKYVIYSLDFTVSESEPKIKEKKAAIKQLLQDIFSKNHSIFGTKVNILGWHHIICGLNSKSTLQQFPVKPDKKKKIQCSIRTTDLNQFGFFDGNGPQNMSSREAELKTQFLSMKEFFRKIKK